MFVSVVFFKIQFGVLMEPPDLLGEYCGGKMPRSKSEAERTRFSVKEGGP